MERNILLTIAYDGSQFHGWQRQPKERTVQGELEATMTGLFKRQILISGTSRTDAGVHALDQKATFKTDIGIPVEKIPFVLNNALNAREGREFGRGGFAKSPIQILAAEEKPAEFHARFDAKGKEYIYRIRDERPWGQSRLLQLFERNYIYKLDTTLDVTAMNEAAKVFVGEHDFKSFEASGGNPRETTVRTIYGAEVVDTRQAQGAEDFDGLMMPSIEFRVRGNGFLYNMVRIMTGTLVEVGQGKKEPEDIIKIIDGVNREMAGHTAPPNGLYLNKVFY